MKPYEAKKAPPFYLEDMLKMTEYCLKTVEVSRFISIIFLKGVKTLIRSLNKRKHRPSRRDMRAGMKPYEPKVPPFYLEDMLKMREYCLKTVEMEKFAIQEKDTAILFGENSRPFRVATIKTFLGITMRQQEETT
ncbi:predicted protein [Nematostella vectensis]|uniref:Uncharacterized protein n=1 Tax=Nematostella vectensis TaxID=45351 RepID=A7SDB6_NEMVE|nr:predicted protein [Nematostella vectensis]|eukprot:XP_001630344.1 predicted protein [Nematostella vectensis]